MERWWDGIVRFGSEGTDAMPRTLRSQIKRELLREGDLRYRFWKSGADRNRAPGQSKQLPRPLLQQRV